MFDNGSRYITRGVGNRIPLDIDRRSKRYSWRIRLFTSIWYINSWWNRKNSKNNSLTGSTKIQEDMDSQVKWALW